MGVIIINLVIQLNKKQPQPQPKPTENIRITTNHLQPVVLTHRIQLTKNQMMQDYDPQWTIDRINVEITNEIMKQIEPFIVKKSWEDINGVNNIESHLTILSEKN